MNMRCTFEAGLNSLCGHCVRTSHKAWGFHRPLPWRVLVVFPVAELLVDYRSPEPIPKTVEEQGTRSGRDDKRGTDKNVTISDHTHIAHRPRGWSEDDFDLDDLVLPDQPTWQRCGSVHCIDHGPWIGTLVCCVRRSGHADGHGMSLGDIGEPDYWRETWF